jgi:hypothetical protein
MTYEQMIGYVAKAVAESASEPRDRRFRIFADRLPDSVLSTIISGIEHMSDPTFFNENLPLIAETNDKVVALMGIGNNSYDVPFPFVVNALAFEQVRRHYPDMEIYVPIDPYDEGEHRKAYELLVKSIPDSKKRQFLEHEIARTFQHRSQKSFVSRVLARIRRH